MKRLQHNVVRRGNMDTQRDTTKKTFEMWCKRFPGQNIEVFNRVQKQKENMKTVKQRKKTCSN